MRWAFTAEITGAPDGEWALVRVEEQAATVRAFATHLEAVAAMCAITGERRVEAFTAPIRHPGGATWAVVWGDGETGDNHVQGCLTNHDSLMAMAELVEADPGHPNAAEDAAKLRRAAMELVH